MLRSSGIENVAFDTDPKRVAQGRADGNSVSYGDISEPELQTTINVGQASLVIVTINNSAMALRAVSSIRKAYPHVPIIARARDLKASLRLGATALEILSVPTDSLDSVVQGVRDWNYKSIAEKESDK